MKVFKNNSDKLDQIFSEGLNDLHVPPPQFKHREEDPVDNAVKHKLDEFEQTPNPEIWDNIKTQIPLSLKVKRQLTWLSKIAAVLVVGLVVTMLINSYSRAQRDIVIENDNEKEAVPVIPIESDFVFDLKDKSKSNDKVQEKEKSARELFSDEYEIAERQKNLIEPITPLETKASELLTSNNNPLDDEQKKSETLGKMPLRTNVPANTEMLSLTPEEDENKASSEEKQ